MNEKITEEIGKITDTAKTFTDEAGKLVLDRFRNPYILTFLISWILFNWKPISFFIFSKGNVEYKIKFIITHYSDSLNYFFYPFGITLLYLFALPYLNMINEWFILFSIKKRANFIASQAIHKIDKDTEIAAKEIVKEFKISKARNAENENKTIKDLNQMITELQRNLSTERSEKQEIILQYENDIQDIKDTNLKVVENLNKESSNIKNQYDQLKTIALDQENKFSKKINDAEKKYEISEFLYNRMKDPVDKLIKLNNNRSIFETFEEDSDAIYYDIENKKAIKAAEFFSILKNSPSIEILEGESPEFLTAKNNIRHISSI
ncbi:hypothetical protein LPB90_18645 [Chryseobacterium sp. LC2016-29]|uniref:hypothetical protein n=1 Tax=Chryseobacterium sp. LC2016-29 TaxID=2897331 RepID=UPI001E2BA107|nr:hypothetical protein [Chryseobacterium sp. LC2016-29]MCD0480463.1 hypothetical protein [Chryseobacterium sp. LC2016-29]